MALQELNRAMVKCTLCPELVKSRTQVVPNDGPETAQVVFIGEAPGYHEDQQGKPFVGPAGQFLNSLLAMVGWRREEVFITNVIKCRPPGNRDPLPMEIASCSQWLDQQLGLLHPKAIVTLGRYSMARFFPGQSISKIHGTFRWADSTLCYAMYHPAAALHQQTLRHTIEEDMKKLLQVLAQARPSGESEPKEESDAQQLSLF